LKSASSLPSIYSSTSLPAIQPLPPPSTSDITAQVRSFLLEKWKVGWGQDVEGKEFAKAVELLSQVRREVKEETDGDTGRGGRC
jgi:ABC-type phosphate transport system substrate-binding protein